jgi:hypothetical protein
VYNLKFNKSIKFKKEEGTLLKDIIQSYEDLKGKSQSMQPNTIEIQIILLTPDSLYKAKWDSSSFYSFCDNQTSASSMLATRVTIFQRQPPSRHLNSPSGLCQETSNDRDEAPGETTGLTEERSIFAPLSEPGKQSTAPILTFQLRVELGLDWRWLKTWENLNQIRPGPLARALAGWAAKSGLDLSAPKPLDENEEALPKAKAFDSRGTPG